MNTHKCLSLTLLLVAAVAAGCARAARDTSGFAMIDKATVSAPLMDTWQAAKAVLREQAMDIYTRDKRGVLVAYAPMRRSLLVPNRVQFTITMAESSPTSTEITVESVKQVYGVTLLTYPAWHDRKTTDNQQALAILEAVQAKLSGETAVAPAVGPEK